MPEVVPQKLSDLHHPKEVAYGEKALASRIRREHRLNVQICKVSDANNAEANSGESRNCSFQHAGDNLHRTGDVPGHHWTQS